MDHTSRSQSPHLPPQWTISRESSLTTLPSETQIGRPPSSSYWREGPDITKSTATYGPGTRPNRYGVDDKKDKKAQKMREYIEDELTGFFEQPVKGLVETFFPINEDDPDYLQIFRTDETGIFTGKGDLGYGKRRATLPLPKTKKPTPFQWTLINTTQSAKDEEKMAEKIITANFVKVYNDIIDNLGLSETRVAVDRQNFPLKTRDGGELKPDAIVWGKGTPAFRFMEGTPPSHSQPKHKPRPTIKRKRKDDDDDDYRDDQDNEREEAPPTVEWAWCVIPVEVKTAKERGALKNRRYFYQLGSYAREVLAAQPNRRYVPSLLLTERTAEFVWWDRGGVIASHQLNYHTQARWFCNILATIIKWDDVQLGFDPSMYYRHSRLCIRTREPSEYVVEDTLVHSYTIRGHGSICWRAERLDGKGSTDRFIIQDSWLKVGEGAERMVVLEVENARRNCGMKPTLYIEDVHIHKTALPDTVNNNRRGFWAPTDIAHTRTVMQYNGAPLDTFDSPQSLVYALHDVVKELQKLRCEAMVVHRDVVPWNILVNPDAPDGGRGTLRDFSRSAFVSGLNPPLDKYTGSHLFSPCSHLEGNPENSHLDDLEAIYWTLCFIIVGHSGKDLRATRLSKTPPAQFLLWSVPDGPAAAVAKTQHLQGPFTLPVSEYFGPIAPLAEGLHKFWGKRDRTKRVVERSELATLPSTDAAQDFKDYLEVFTNVIKTFSGTDKTNAVEGATSTNAVEGDTSRGQ